MAKLSDEQREKFREHARLLTENLTPEELTKVRLAAQVTRVSLQSVFPDLCGDDLAKIAHSVRCVISAFAGLDVHSLSLAMESMFVAYSVACASLAGVYDAADHGGQGQEHSRLRELLSGQERPGQRQDAPGSTETDDWRPGNYL